MPNLILIIPIPRKVKTQTVIEVREHLNKNDPNHLKKFTDGFLLDSLNSEEGFVISDLTVQSFFLNEGFLRIPLGVLLNTKGFKFHMQHAASIIFYCQLRSSS